MTNSSREPIAKSYDNLQSLDYIRAFHEGIDPAEPSCSRARLVSSASLELVLICCSDLNRRATRLANRMTIANVKKISHIALWEREFFSLGLKISDLYLSQSANASSDRAAFSIGETKAALEYKESRQAFEDLLLKKSENSTFRATLRKNIEDHGSYTSVASFVHSFKCSSHLYRCISLRLYPSSKDARSLDELPYWKNLKLAVEAISLSRETYLTQFRVLHQIPELLALEIATSCAPIVNCTDTPTVSAKDVLCILKSVSSYARLMVDCLQPISICMFPADYQEIRRNLGKTSGSQSQAISHNLLSKLVSALSESIEIMFQSNKFLKSPYHNLIGSELSTIFQILDLWRDMHLSFPRNVLGTGTVSLIGAPDAVDAVNKMKCTAQNRREKELTRLPPSFESARRIATQANDASHKSSCELGGFEAVLLKLTGDVMQSRFPDVQNRCGFFSGNGDDQ